MAAGLTEPTEGLGAVGGYKDLAKYTTLGGRLFVFALPDASLIADESAAMRRDMPPVIWAACRGLPGASN